jgi:hypothetical protein
LLLDAREHTIARYITEEVTVGGVTLRHGEWVSLLDGVANHDWDAQLRMPETDLLPEPLCDSDRGDVRAPPPTSLMTVAVVAV